jgi:hypothetical protein
VHVSINILTQTNNPCDYVQVATRAAEVEQLLKANNIKGALSKALESPPTTAKSKDIKVHLYVHIT